MVDTHCHLNFSVFDKNLETIVNKARVVGVNQIVVPSTNLNDAYQAVAIAQRYPEVYAAVGIHPLSLLSVGTKFILPIDELKRLLTEPKVVAVGEVGLDRKENPTSDIFCCQKISLKTQINLAASYNKSLILHSRQGSKELLKLLRANWNKNLAGRTVFHCCESETVLLTFAKKHHIYLGVDGDITFSPVKQHFFKLVPLELLVLETDSPFLLPEPLRAKKLYPNEPANLIFIAKKVAEILNLTLNQVIKVTTINARRLFNLPKD
jgi:TatD DNase family protein